jgi:hypothetical protein
MLETLNYGMTVHSPYAPMTKVLEYMWRKTDPVQGEKLSRAAWMFINDSYVT